MVRHNFWIVVLLGVVWTAASLGADIKPVSFQSNGDLIQGWYWLRDPSLEQKAWWTFEGIPVQKDGVVLEITCLATDRPGGQRGGSATFRLGYGFPGAGMMGGVFMVQEVNLPNVSPADDPVGYTCRGTVLIPPDTPGLAAGKLTVFAERISPASPHVAFNQDSVVVRIATPPTSAERLRTMEATSFAANGPLIQGSHWCREHGQFLEWSWGPVAPGGEVAEAAVNLSLLVTNTYNGGSGYSVRVIVQILTLDGAKVHSESVDIRNPFLPQFSGDTEGVGYAAYGALSLPVEVFERYQLFVRGFRLRIDWPPMHSDYHFAGAQGSALLAWIEAK